MERERIIESILELQEGIATPSPRQVAMPKKRDPILIYEDQDQIRVYDYSDKSLLIMIPRELGKKNSHILGKFSSFGTRFTVDDRLVPGWIMPKRRLNELNAWLATLDEVPTPASPRAAAPPTVFPPGIELGRGFGPIAGTPYEIMELSDTQYVVIFPDVFLRGTKFNEVSKFGHYHSYLFVNNALKPGWVVNKGDAHLLEKFIQTI